MANREPSRDMVINVIVRLVIVVAICAATVWVVSTHRPVFDAVVRPFGTIGTIGRALFRVEQSRPADVPQDELDARDIAAAVAIDVEGERSTCLGKARLELIDITLRAKKRLPDLTYRQIVAKALTWVPDNWDYLWPWQDRDSSIAEMGRSETVKEIIPIVLERMRTGPGDGCAAKIIRAKFHLFGALGGEGKAVREIRTYPKDPRFADGACATDFRCLP